MRSDTLLSRSDSWIPALAAVLLVAVAGCRDDAESPTGPEPTVLATASARALEFRQVSAGHTHTCGVTMANQAYCWGFNWAGQLGDGSTSDRFLPVAVAGHLQFSHVSVGLDHSCGVTLQNQAYCWGRNAEGQLGDASVDNRFKPVAVAGPRRFREVEAGTIHTCGIDLADRAYCWGANTAGELGDGTLGTQRTIPVRVLGGLSWRQLSSGNGFTCGVATGNRAYCWGDNGSGQLGDGTRFRRVRPTPVAGGFLIRQGAAGGAHSCGVTGPTAGASMARGSLAMGRPPVR